MQVSESVKNAYKKNSITKHLVLYFPEINKEVSGEKIYEQSMSLSESIFDADSIEFVGCIASKFKIQINGLNADVKGKKIQAVIHTDGTEEEPVVLFNGIVDSAMRQGNKRIKEITAYDELYVKGNIDVAKWYKKLTFPITLKDFRDSLFRYIGIEQVEIALPNDSVSIQKRYNPNTLQALPVIKAICQINGAFGIINRQNKFEYRILQDIIPSEDAYPGIDLFPPFYPGIGGGSGGSAAENINYYKKVDYEEYLVKPVDKLTIRQTEDDEGITYGTGDNNYIIQGNMFTYKLSNSVLTQIAERIYENVKGISYIPFTSDNNGLPYVECGKDIVNYYVLDYDSNSNTDTYKKESFYVFNRELSGIQALRDSYSVKGEEYQKEFITDLNLRIDTIKKNIKKEVEEAIEEYDFSGMLEDYTYDKEYLDERFDNLPTGFNVLSVTSLPANPDPNTIYLIQGTVVVN